MDFFKEHSSFILCSLGSFFCIYQLVKISVENYRATTNSIISQKDEISNNLKPETVNLKRISSNGNGNGNGTPKLKSISSKKHFYQRKLDLYVNDMKVNEHSNLKESESQSYVYKICLTGGPNAGKTTSKLKIKKLT